MRSTTTRFWILRCALVLLGLLPFIGLEILLRWTAFDVEAVSLDPFLDCSRIAPLFVRDGDQLRIPPERLRLFAPAEFPADKASGTRRVFCVGGSTTQGEPYKPATAFPMWLEKNLRLIEPSHDWEIINCGGLSYASYRILPIVLEVLNYSPDLIVIDCGHNEFLEDRELSGWKHTPPVIAKMISVSNSSRLVRFISNCIRSPSSMSTNKESKTKLHREVNALLDDHGGLEKYHRDSLNADAVGKSMVWNLTKIIEACQKASVPVILLVPTSNIRDCPPFKSELSKSLSESDKSAIHSYWSRCEQLQNSDQVEQTPNKKKDSLAIIHELELLLKLDPHHSQALYLLGRKELDVKKIERARQSLVRARDCDVCPLRATSSIQDSIRQLATATNTWMFDVDELFQSVSKDRLVGEQWLVDHVHPRIEGHQLLGEQLAEFLVDQAWAIPANNDWKENRKQVYRDHLQELGEDYFVRGKQRLEGLMLWTQGRARKNFTDNEVQP